MRVSHEFLLPPTGAPVSSSHARYVWGSWVDHAVQRPNWAWNEPRCLPGWEGWESRDRLLRRNRACRRSTGNHMPV